MDNYRYIIFSNLWLCSKMSKKQQINIDLIAENWISNCLNESAGGI